MHITTQLQDRKAPIMTSPDEIKTSVLSIRIKPSIKASADKRAKEENRSLANYIEWLIEQDALAAAEKPKGKAKR